MLNYVYIFQILLSLCVCTFKQCTLYSVHPALKQYVHNIYASLVHDICTTMFFLTVINMYNVHKECSGMYFEQFL